MGAALFALAQLGSATTCTSGTLANYLALGSAGCTIGGDTFSGFQTLSGQTGATPIAVGSVMITPGGTSAAPELTFTTTTSAVANSLFESIFNYKISGINYTSSALSLRGASETVDGAVTDIENFCAGGSFGAGGVSGCTGTAGSLLTLDGIQNSDISSLGPISFVSITDDYTVDGGTAGSASGGIFTNTFAAVTATPEPGSILLAGLGFALAASIRVFRTNRKEI
jgi:hypothetical protein